MSIKLELTEEWKKAYTLLSVQASAVVAIIAAAIDYLPQVKEYMPEGWVKYAAIIIIVCRLIKQERPPTP